MPRAGNHPVGKPAMNTGGKSDASIVPSNRANRSPGFGGRELNPLRSLRKGRDAAKGNVQPSDPPRARQAETWQVTRVGWRSRSQLGSVPELQFTSLLHHVTEDLLREAFFDLKKTAAVGVDEVSWIDYEQGHEERLADLHSRLHRGAYRAQPSKRIYIPKADGRQRPIGIASLEDKVVQKAVVWVMQCIYEQDFANFSYAHLPSRLGGPAGTLIRRSTLCRWDCLAIR